MMKPQMMDTAARRLSWQRLLPLSAVALLAVVATAQAQTDQILRPIGGDGGGQFVARCDQGEILTGFDLRTGDDVDAIRPLCVTVSGPANVGPIEPYPAQFGGGGGGPRRVACPGSAPLVVGMEILAEGVKTVIVNNVHLFCGEVIANQVPAANPTAIFDGPPAQYHDAIIFQTGNMVRKTGSNGPQTCPRDLVAVGINGRYGVWLDAVGLICGPLPATAQAPVDSVPGNAGKPPVSLGRAHARTAGASITDRAITTVPRRASAIDAIRARAGSRAGIFAPVAPPAARPPVAPADRGAFMPPLFADGARLWACANTAQGNAKGAACRGKKSGKAYCKMQGFSGALQQRADGAPGVAVAAVRPGTHVRAINGDTCTANACVAISELRCVP